MNLELIYDREKVIENLKDNKNEIRQNFTKVIEDLKEQKLKFHSYNKETCTSSVFDIDSEKSEKFSEWYLENVKEKCYSSIMFKYDLMMLESKQNMILKN